jgi:hypothetical protein
MWLAGGSAAATLQTPPGAGIDYSRDIRPILSDACYACHGPDEESREADLRLDRKADALAERDEGATAIVPGHPDRSELYRRLISHDPDERMPPGDSGKSLKAEQIERIRHWIEQGADWQEHWAFVPPQRPALPTILAGPPAHHPIDYFLRARMVQEGLKPAPPADPLTLVRRVTLDLTGLPPTPSEIDAFLDDASPDAYPRLVDRLLKSPRYGEHMARYWLDVARYGDTHGLHLDNERAIWPFRDWVIAAYNRNMPFDAFTIEQLAGDLLPNASIEQRIATGFIRCHVTTNEGGVIKEEFYVRNTVDRVETTATVWMGLTAGCAVCHDHKFDPLTKREFYQLFAFFNSTADDSLDGNAVEYPPVIKLPTPEQSAKLEELRTRIAGLEEAAAKRAQKPADAEPDNKAPSANGSGGKKDVAAKNAALNGAATEKPVVDPELEAARKELAELDKSVPMTMVMQELAEPREAFDLTRGEYDKPADKVTRKLPAFLPPLPAGSPVNRLGLAQWLVTGNHPLTARVAVNRIWQQHMGTGIVKTAEDFGSQGQWPSHPELLDWLACEFVSSGWNVQHLQRLIVTSDAYRQSAEAGPKPRRADPENRLFTRGPRFRMDAEMVRDAALFAGGLLVEKVGGTGVRPYQPPGIWEAVGYTSSNTARYTQDHGAALFRRSLYTFWKRTAPPPAMLAMDAPSRETCTVRRPRTNTPLAALVLMNDPQMFEAARHLADRMIREGGSEAPSRIALGFRLATGRLPDRLEVDVLMSLYERHRNALIQDKQAAQILSVGELPAAELPAGSRTDARERAAWTMVANAILNLDEFVTKG